MPRGARREMVGQPQDLICNGNQHVELEDMVDQSKSNPSQENVDPQDGGLTLLGFSKIYDSKYDVSNAKRHPYSYSNLNENQNNNIRHLQKKRLQPK